MSATFAGLALDRPRVMGIVNVTPDSFSDGGEVFDAAAAIARGRDMAAAGADILDIGGESTRPGAAPVSLEEELGRVIPVIEGLRGLDTVISIDTRHAPVMEAATAAGAHIVNDVSALTGDADSLATAARLGVPVILMHMKGEPGTMQDNPTYEDAPAEVAAYLTDRSQACIETGIAPERIAVDPGIGFGKTSVHNLQILNRIDEIMALGFPVVMGVSRKRFIGTISGVEDAGARAPGSIAAALATRVKGVQIFRVHDVPETVQALKVFEAIARAER